MVCIIYTKIKHLVPLAAPYQLYHTTLSPFQVIAMRVTNHLPFHVANMSQACQFSIANHFITLLHRKLQRNKLLSIAYTWQRYQTFVRQHIPIFIPKLNVPWTVPLFSYYSTNLLFEIHFTSLKT